MSLALRTHALLDLIASDRASACAEAEDMGRTESDAIVRTAQAEARARVRETLKAERTRRDERLGAADARLANERRRHGQRRALVFLAEAWKRLPDALAQRWETPDGRAQWVRHIAEAALGTLPDAPWSIAHAPGFGPDEREALAAFVASRIAHAPAFATDAGLRAGLRIRSGPNVVDGSLAGLLEDRAAVEARLIGFLEARP